MCGGQLYFFFDGEEQRDARAVTLVSVYVKGVLLMNSRPFLR